MQQKFVAGSTLDVIRGTRSAPTGGPEHHVTGATPSSRTATKPACGKEGEDHPSPGDPVQPDLGADAGRVRADLEGVVFYNAGRI